MTAVDQLKIVCILGPIVGLLALGFFISLRSGVATLSTGQGVRVLFVNLSKAMLLLSCCVIGLVMLHQFAGFPLIPLR